MIKIGHNPNTNMLPMFHFLPQKHPLLELITAEPAVHNALLAAGKIDMAPISAFAYGLHWQEYTILPNLSVSNKGKVGSILLFSKGRIEELAGKSVALTDQSATSVHLLKILLHRFYEVTPSYVTMPPDLNKMFGQADAALLIGDSAIKESLQNPDCYIYDLGEEWLNWTGCSMTYSVWAFPNKLLSTRSSDVQAVYRLLLEAKAKALMNLSEVVNASISMLGETPSFWHDYFVRFSYDLTPELLAGLDKYFALCYEEGFFANRPIFDIWPGGDNDELLGLSGAMRRR